MLTKVNVDHRLLEKAKSLGGHRTDREAVTAALTEYVQRRSKLEILSLFGTIDYDPDHNYKRARERKQ